LIPQSLHQIKREIRVLGVAARQDSGGFTIISVVYRGNLWLDGVLRAHSEEADITDAVAEMLVDSPHSGQIRVIIMSRENLPGEVRVSPEELRTKTGKTVILLGDAGETSYTWSNNDDKVTFSAAGLSRLSAEGVLRASTREGVTPEALKVAALTLSALPIVQDA